MSYEDSVAIIATLLVVVAFLLGTMLGALTYRKKVLEDIDSNVQELNRDMGILKRSIQLLRKSLRAKNDL